MDKQDDLLHGVLPPHVAAPAAVQASARPAPPMWVPVRVLGPRHRARILAHLLSLPPEDRALRFGYAASDEQIERYVQSLDFWRDEVFGVFDWRLRLVALAHLALDAGRGEGEFGVSVLPRLRGRRIGMQLFAHAVTHARNRGVHTLMIQLARHNAPMLAIVRAAGATVEYDGGEALARVTLGPATWGTHMGALVEAQAAEVDFQFKWQLRRLGRMWPRWSRMTIGVSPRQPSTGGSRRGGAAVGSPRS